MTLVLPSFRHSTLGFERFFREFEKLADNDNQKVVNFPPHNIIRLEENLYLIEMAVAGFSRNEIEITMNDGNLVVKGEKKETNQNVEYIHRGIVARSFRKSFSIADSIEVRGSEFVDGVLRIALENIVPEHKKPRKILIGDSLNNLTPQLLQELKAA